VHGPYPLYWYNALLWYPVDVSSSNIFIAANPPTCSNVTSEIMFLPRFCTSDSSFYNTIKKNINSPNQPSNASLPRRSSIYPHYGHLVYGLAAEKQTQIWFERTNQLKAIHKPQSATPNSSPFRPSYRKMWKVKTNDKHCARTKLKQLPRPSAKRATLIFPALESS
jgi:hypothetical protein